MTSGPHQVTYNFEQAICKYTNAPYAVAVDNCTSALFLCLIHENIKGKEITIPSRTYPSVPCSIIQAGGKVKFKPVDGTTIKGAYNLEGSNIWDSALTFSYDMYKKGTHMCVSFTGPYKHLKLSKGGAILTDDYKAYLWFKRARYNGRRECSYHDDNFDMLGWNFYMMPEIAARGLLLMSQFYDSKGNPIVTQDIEMSYPDLSKFEIYNANI